MSSHNQPLPKDEEREDVASFAVLLAIAVLIILLLGLVGLPGPSEDTGFVERVILTILAGGILLATLRIARVSGERQRWLGIIVGILITASIIGFLLTSNPLFGQIVAFVWVLLVFSAPVFVLKRVLSADHVNVQTILGSIAVYLLLGVSLALLSIAMQHSVGFFEEVPRSTAYVYFAFVTITSLGYGDLSPYTDGARMASVAAAVTAQMYLVIVVARLVSIWRQDQTPTDDGNDR